MDKIEDVIAESNRIFKRPDGTIISCSIQIGRPFKYDKFSLACYACPIMITGFGDSKVSLMYGEDTFECVQHAFEILDVLFRMYQRNGRFFLDEHDTIGTDTILPKDRYEAE